MRLERLELTEAYGEARALCLALEEGARLEVVVGRNGSGKTTLARTLAAALWSAEPEPFAARLALRGEAGESLDAELTPYRAPRRIGEWPRRPPAELRDCWCLALETFDEAGGRAAVVERLRTELDAGYDLDAVRALGGREGSRRRGAVQARRELDERLETVRRLRQEMEELLEREGERAQHEARLERVRAAAARARSLERQLELVHARREHRLCAARFEELPTRLDRLRPEDLATLDQLRDQLRDRAEDVERLARAEVQLVEELAALRLPERGISSAARAHLGDREADLVLAERARHEAEEALERARARLAADPGPGADFESLDAVLRAGEALERLRGEERELEAERARLAPGGGNPESSRDACLRDRVALVDWLSAHGADDRAWARLPWALLACLLALGAAVTVGVEVLVAGALALASAVCAFVAWRTARPGASSASRASVSLATGAPRAWTAEAVAERLLEVLAALERFEREARRAARRAELEGELERRRAERGAAAEALACAQRTAGLPEDREGHHAMVVAERWKRREERAEALRHDLSNAEQRCEAARGIEARARAVRDEVLEAIGVTPPESASASDHLARELEGKEAKRRELAEQLGARREELELARTRHARTAADAVAFLEQRELDNDPAQAAVDRLEEARPELERGLAARPDYVDARDALRDARRRERDALLRLEEAGDPVPTEDASVDELERARERALEADGERDRLHEELVNLKRDLDEARRSRDLEEAEAELEEARARLEEVLDGELEDEALTELLEDLQQRWEGNPNRTLVRRAGSLFASFTGHAYELVDTRSAEEDDGLGLMARPTGGGPARSLATLSAGTRAQLQLALRLAVIEGEELGGERLPLVVDEALTNTDPERMERVGTALCELVRAGRQVLYLTSDPIDAERLREAAEAAAVPFGRHDLDGLARAGARARAEGVAVLAPHRPPAPRDGEDGADYLRRLGVARFDPFASVEALPLGHLLSDRPRLLFELERAGLTRVGTLLAAARAGALGESLRRAWGDVLEARVQVARAFLGVWRAGRAPRLDPEALRGLRIGEDARIDERTKKADEIVAVAERVEGDARRLLSALRDKAVARLKTSFVDDLEEALEPWLPRGERLEGSTLEEAVLLEAAEPIGDGRLSRADAAALVRALERAAGVAEGRAARPRAGTP